MTKIRGKKWKKVGKKKKKKKRRLVGKEVDGGWDVAFLLIMENFNILNSMRRKTCIIERARKTDFFSGFVSLQTVPSLFGLIIPPFFFFFFSLCQKSFRPSVCPSVRPWRRHRALN